MSATRQPRLRLGELVLDKQMEKICVVMDRAQSHDRHHRVTVFCPGTVTWFTTKESDFIRLSTHNQNQIRRELKLEKAKAWDRILAPVREQAKKEKEQAIARAKEEREKQQHDR